MLRTLRVPLLAVLLLGLCPVAARATYHLMKIVEVFGGTVADPAAQYVMLQMYFPGQNLVMGHSVTVYDASGTVTGTFTFGGNVANGANLSTILIATPDAETLFGVTADLTMTAAISPAGGAACWDVVDCVAWGSFSAPDMLPTAPAPVFNAPTGLIAGMAMHRDLSAGGTVTDFVSAAPAPKNNAGQTGEPTATPTVPVVATPTPTPGVGCTGDCNGNSMVTVDEIITLVNIVLGNIDASACAHGIPPTSAGDITFIIQAVNNALNGCGPSPQEQGCINSGGTVSTALCCASAPDFPDTCAIGACGCSPASSIQVNICECAAGACFNRTENACVPINGE